MLFLQPALTPQLQAKGARAFLPGDRGGQFGLLPGELDQSVRPALS